MFSKGHTGIQRDIQKFKGTYRNSKEHIGIQRDRQELKGTYRNSKGHKGIHRNIQKFKWTYRNRNLLQGLILDFPVPCAKELAAASRNDPLQLNTLLLEI